MSYKKSNHWKELKEGMIIIALGHYHESLDDDHPEIDALEEVMAEYGFFQDDYDTPKPTLSVIDGGHKPKKRTKKAKLKLHSK